MGVGVLIVCHMADGDCALLLHVAQKRALVVSHEVEDTVVVGDGESDTVDTFPLSRRAPLRLELQTVEGGQHAKLELQLILIRDLKVPPAVPDPLRERDGVCLQFIVNFRSMVTISRMGTYSVLRDTVDARVGDIGQSTIFSQVMLDRVHAQMSGLMECPAAHSLGELPVPGLDSVLVTGALNLSFHPLVLEHLGGANNSETSRVATLEGGHEVQLLASGKYLVN